MKLTRKQAIDLIPCILDGEATEKETRAFFDYLEDDDSVKKQFESLKIVKELIRKKCKRDKAPDRLKNKVSELISDLEWEEHSYSRVDNSPNSIKNKIPNSGDSTVGYKKIIYNLLKPMRYVAAAAVIFFFSLITIELLDRTSTSQLPIPKNLEEIVFAHFENSDNFSEVLTSVTPDDINHASEYLEAEFSYFPVCLYLMEQRFRR